MISPYKFHAFIIGSVAKCLIFTILNPITLVFLFCSDFATVSLWVKWNECPLKYAECDLKNDWEIVLNDQVIAKAGETKEKLRQELKEKSNDYDAKQELLKLIPKDSKAFQSAPEALKEDGDLIINSNLFILKHVDRDILIRFFGARLKLVHNYFFVIVSIINLHSFQAL